ncbi:MAG TPA: hypothetical protein VII63_08550 [Caulobacteraceae bacterium]
MSAMMLALAGARPAAGAAGGVTPNALPWKVIYGITPASTQPLQVTGITNPITVSASLAGGASLAHILNGAVTAYSGPFVVNLNDYLAWQVSGAFGTDYSGTITVTNTTDSGALLAHVTYILHGSF